LPSDAPHVTRGSDAVIGLGDTSISQGETLRKRPAALHSRALSACCSGGAVAWQEIGLVSGHRYKLVSSLKQTSDWMLAVPWTQCTSRSVEEATHCPRREMLANSRLRVAKSYMSMYGVLVPCNTNALFCCKGCIQGEPRKLTVVCEGYLDGILRSIQISGFWKPMTTKRAQVSKKAK
jgi:hypothetical protein